MTTICLCATWNLLVVVIVVVVFLVVFIVIVVIVILLLGLGWGFSWRCTAWFALSAICGDILRWRNDKMLNSNGRFVIKPQSRLGRGGKMCHNRSTSLYLLILLLQFSSLFLIGLLVLCGGAVPHLTQPLGNISNCQTRGLTFHLRAEICAKDEEGRSGGGKGKK